MRDIIEMAGNIASVIAMLLSVPTAIAVLRQTVFRRKPPRVNQPVDDDGLNDRPYERHRDADA